MHFAISLSSPIDRVQIRVFHNEHVAVVGSLVIVRWAVCDCASLGKHTLDGRKDVNPSLTACEHC